MNKERQKYLQNQIDETFSAIVKLNETITAKDFEWAEKNWDKDIQLAGQIVNLAEDIIDWGKQFR